MLTDALRELGIPSAEDIEEARRAYRRRLRETHPDMGGSAEDLARVCEAWQAILEGLEEPTPPPSFGGPSDAGSAATATTVAPPRPDTATDRRSAPTVPPRAVRLRALPAARPRWRTAVVAAVAVALAVLYAVVVRSVMVGPLAIYGAGWVVVSFWHALGRPRLTVRRFGR